MVNFASLANASAVGETVTKMAGNWSLVIGAVILLVGFFIVLYVLKNIIANAVTGIIVFLIVKYLLGVAIPINGLTILVTIFGGLGGVAALLIAAFFGWL